MVSYGLDYSARELSPAEVRGYTGHPITFLIRYIGYPTNGKCISHYPGAYAAHVHAGISVLLVAEGTTRDAAGGRAAGVAMAQRALADARSIGYPDTAPIFFCADGWLNSLGIPLATAMAYLDGAASVVGPARVGAYGFRDFLVAAQAQGKAPLRWLAGSAPTDAEIRAGLCQLYQSNSGAVSVAGMSCDLNWSYVDVAALSSGGTVPTPGDDPLMALTDGEAHELLQLARNLYFQLFTGDPGKPPGWHTFPGGTDETLTPVDYLRRANVETRGLATRITHLEQLLAALAPGAPGAPATVTADDRAQIAIAVADELARRAVS